MIQIRHVSRRQQSDQAPLTGARLQIRWWDRPRVVKRASAGLAVALFCLAATIPSKGAVFPDVIPLPNGFNPEGIATGYGTEFFVGSIGTGAIYKGDLRTGTGQILVQPIEGRAAIGLSFDLRSGVLFVAGGPTGSAFVYDGETGAALGEWHFTDGPTFVNDVVVTREAAYFTDSMQPVLYRVPLGPGGEFEAGVFEVLPLGGEYEHVAGFNANGIDATANGKWLIIVNSTSGKLYRVDPLTGDATEIDLGGVIVNMGDGILLHGHTLYVVRNRANEIVVLELNPQLTEGVLVETITNPAFRVPTTIARHGNALYAVNARFGTPVTPDTEYEVVRVEL